MRRILDILRESRGLERERARRGQYLADERAFLPAVLEVTETPPSPTARIIAWVLVGFVSIALLWAWIGRVNEVAVAEARTVASGRSKLLQPAEGGIITAIHVRDGQQVREGELLVELDTTITSAERDRLRTELLAARVQAARLRALLATMEEGRDPLEAFAPPPETGADKRDRQRVLLLAEVAEQRARQAGFIEEIARRQAERVTTEAVVRRLTDIIPLIQARSDARATLARDGHGSRLIFLEQRQQLVEAQHDRVIQTQRMAEIDAAVTALQGQARAQAAEFLRARHAELTEAERQVATLSQELVKAEQRSVQTRLTAPIDGTVQQLAVHTVGGVVQAAQQLMVIAPRDDRLELEAMVLNRDIGFVQPGQSVEVKLETFTFTRFGLVPAEVVSVSADAIQDERRGLVYAARIRLLRDTIVINGRETALVPGMAATAEIQTGRRRVISYLLSPIARYGHEAMRER